MTVEGGRAHSAHVRQDMSRTYCLACNRDYAEYRGVKCHAVLHHNLRCDQRTRTLVDFDSKEDLNQAIATAKRAQQPDQKRRSDEYFRGPPPLRGRVMHRARVRGHMSMRGVRFASDNYRYQPDVACKDVSESVDTCTVVMRASEYESSRPLFRNASAEGSSGDAPGSERVGTSSVPPVLAGVRWSYPQSAGDAHKVGKLGSVPGESKMSLLRPGGALILLLCHASLKVCVRRRHHFV